TVATVREDMSGELPVLAWGAPAVLRARRVDSAGGRDLDRDAVEDGVTGERIDEHLVGEDVRVDAGVRGGDRQPGAVDVVAPAVGDRDDAGHDVGRHLDGDLDGAGARADA